MDRPSQSRTARSHKRRPCAATDTYALTPMIRPGQDTPRQHALPMDALIAQLEDASQKFKLPDQQFETAVASLGAVLEYLETEPRIAGRNLHQPLRDLFFAVVEQLNNSPETRASHPLLDLEQRRPKKTRQANASENLLKGGCLAMMDIMSGRGVPIPLACKLLASELDRQGINYRAQALQQLRDSVGAGRSNKMVADVREQLTASYTALPILADADPKTVARSLVGGFVSRYGDATGMRGRDRWKKRQG